MRNELSRLVSKWIELSWLRIVHRCDLFSFKSGQKWNTVHIGRQESFKLHQSLEKHQDASCVSFFRVEQLVSAADSDLIQIDSRHIYLSIRLLQWLCRCWQHSKLSRISIEIYRERQRLPVQIGCAESRRVPSGSNCKRILTTKLLRKWFTYCSTRFTEFPFKCTSKAKESSNHCKEGTFLLCQTRVWQRSNVHVREYQSRCQFNNPTKVERIGELVGGIERGSPDDQEETSNRTHRAKGQN